MILQNPGMHDMAMKTDETAVANPAPCIHINGTPLMGISMARQDVGAHDMTGMTSMTSSDPGFKLSIANDMAIDMEVVETVAVRSLTLLPT